MEDLPIISIIAKEGIELPKAAHTTDGAVDLRANIKEEIPLAFGEQTLVPTGIKVSLPKTDHLPYNWCFEITPRSGLANKFGITVTNSPGLIDAGYQGELMVIFKNTKMDRYLLKPNERMAQMKLTRSYKWVWNPVDHFSDETERGEGGLGHTGVS